jgi:uncharacterized membrane protein YbhN (UPF0104 family)
VSGPSDEAAPPPPPAHLPPPDAFEAQGLDALRVPAELVEQELGGKSRARWVVEVVASLAITAAIFAFAIPAIVGSGYGEIWDQLGQLSAWSVAGLFALWIVVMLTYTGVLTSTLPGLKHTQALVVNFAGSAVSNVVPFGGAVGVAATYAINMSWGFTPPAVTLSILVTGIWNVFTKLAVPVLALVVLIAAGEATEKLILPAAIGVAVLAGGVTLLVLVLRSERLAERVGDVAERIGARLHRLVRREVRWHDAVLDFRHRSIGLLRHAWWRLSLWMLAYNLGQFLLLLACVRALGTRNDELGWIEVLAAFAFANLLATISITPSGVGFVEAGTVAALIAFGGPEAGSAAAVFLYRGFTYLMEIPLGGVGWVVWGLRRSWRRPVGGAGQAGRPPHGCYD